MISRDVIWHSVYFFIYRKLSPSVVIARILFLRKWKQQNFFTNLKPFQNVFTDRPVLALYNILSRFICVCLQTGYGLVNGFIDHLHSPLVTTSNYSATANLHTLQFTAVNTKSSLARSVFNSRFLVTDVNSGYSSASLAQVLPVRRISRNWTLSIPLSWPGAFVI
jgi:hypothetical protein